MAARVTTTAFLLLATLAVCCIVPVAHCRALRHEASAWASASAARGAGDGVQAYAASQRSGKGEHREDRYRNSGDNNAPAEDKNNQPTFDSQPQPAASWSMPGEAKEEQPQQQNSGNKKSQDNGGSSGDGVSDAVLKAVLDQHNSYRATHGVPALSWSASLASTAQAWAGRCVFEHSGGDLGENLAQGHQDFKLAVSDWYNEASEYNYSNGDEMVQSGPVVGHFTQIVWKSTTSLGCGSASCGGSPLYVCNYSPAGNMVGSFKDNVFPPNSGASTQQ